MPDRRQRGEDATFISHHLPEYVPPTPPEVKEQLRKNLTMWGAIDLAEMLGVNKP